ncbi:primosomal replication protein PriC [Agarivorans sp. MS3-6]|uniref:primosomal replication protein PriC n=1 Tax=Agarivorans sp. TSD2052 TaxID=2937286 RepID=UPI00200E5010|nr:primosomal replication protein PriC [Agarivorans sp. TSD2052]UPW16919.1 primosomal replication protein [Agarivorans sp. TSD2052]
MASMVQLELKKLSIKLEQLRLQADQRDLQGERSAYAKMAVLDERFSCRSDLFSDYVRELERDLLHIYHLSQLSKDIELLQIYCDRFVGKFAMLQTQIDKVKRYQKRQFIPQQQRVASWQKKLEKIINSGDRPQLQDKLLQQKQFEQQLQQKIAEKNQVLIRSNPKTDTARLSAEILSLKSRLGECQKTTWKLEQKINQLESR